MPNMSRIGMEQVIIDGVPCVSVPGLARSLKIKSKTKNWLDYQKRKHSFRDVLAILDWHRNKHLFIPVQRAIVWAEGCKTRGRNRTLGLLKREPYYVLLKERRILGRLADLVDYHVDNTNAAEVLLVMSYSSDSQKWSTKIQYGGDKFAANRDVRRIDGALMACWEV